MTPFFLQVPEKRAWNDPRDRLMVPGRTFKGIEVAPSLLKFHLLHKNVSDYPTEDAFPVLWIPKTFRIYWIFWFLAYISKHFFFPLLLTWNLVSPLSQKIIFPCLGTMSPSPQDCRVPSNTGHGDLVNTGSLDLRKMISIVLKPISFYLEEMEPFLKSTKY